MKKLLLVLALLFILPLSAEAITGTTCPGDGCKDINTGGQGTIGIQITGTWTGTITFKASINNTDFTAISALPIGSTTTVTTTTSNGFWTITCAGISTVRVQFTSGGTGTANVSARTAQAKAGPSGGGGGGGTPGGSDTQLQYNNAGAFGGISGATTNGTFVTLTTPVLGVATATSINKVAITAPATSATLTLADGSTLATSGANSITLTTTGTTNVTFPTSGTLATVGGTAGGADFTNAGVCQGAVTGTGGQTCRDTTNNVLYRKADGVASGTGGWYRIFADGPFVANQPFRFSWTPRPPGNSLAGDNVALQGDGINIASTGGPTLAPQRRSDTYYMSVTTGTSAGNQGELYDTNFGSSMMQWSLYNWDLTFKVRTDASSIADTRLFIGIGTTDPTNADTITGRQLVFRLSSVANAGQWDFLARDNTTTNVTSSVAAAAANTSYVFRIRYTAGTACFSINNAAETCSTTNVPTTADTTNPYIYICVFNVSGSGGTSRSFELGRLGGWIGS